MLSHVSISLAITRQYPELKNIIVKELLLSYVIILSAMARPNPKPFSGCKCKE
jgi:hypothetical protein